MVWMKPLHDFSICWYSRIKIIIPESSRLRHLGVILCKNDAIIVAYGLLWMHVVQFILQLNCTRIGVQLYFFRDILSGDSNLGTRATDGTHHSLPLSSTKWDAFRQRGRAYRYFADPPIWLLLASTHTGWSHRSALAVVQCCGIPNTNKTHTSSCRPPRSAISHLYDNGDK